MSTTPRDARAAVPQVPTPTSRPEETARPQERLVERRQPLVPRPGRLRRPDGRRPFGLAERSIECRNGRIEFIKVWDDDLCVVHGAVVAALS